MRRFTKDFTSKVFIKPSSPNFLERGVSSKYSSKVVRSSKTYSRKMKHKMPLYSSDG
jgi:hypothetical protein